MNRPVQTPTHTNIHTRTHRYVEADKIKHLFRDIRSASASSANRSGGGAGRQPAMVIGSDSTCDAYRCSMDALGYDTVCHQPDEASNAMAYPDNHFAIVCDKQTRPHQQQPNSLAAARRAREIYRVLQPGGVYVHISHECMHRLLTGPLPGLGRPAWNVTYERCPVHMDGAALRHAQTTLARQLGAVHECLPADGAAREEFKALTKAALAADGDEDAR